MPPPTILPTPRMLLLLLAVGLLWAASGLVPFLALLVVLGLVGITAAAVADVRRTPQPEMLIVARDHHSKMGLVADNVVTLLIQNQSDSPLDIIVRDEPPVELKISRGSPRMAARVESHSQARLAYEVRPTRRGDHDFGNVTVR